MKIKIDGLEYEVSETVGKAVHDALAKKDGEIATLKAETEGLKGKADALEASSKAKDAEIKKLKEDAVDEKKAVEIAKARLDVEEVAKAFMGEDFEMEKLSVADIKKAVVEKVTDSKMDGKSEAYIDGQFDVFKKNMDEVGVSSLKRSVGDSVNANRGEGQVRQDSGPSIGMRRQDGQKVSRYDAHKFYKGPGAIQ